MASARDLVEQYLRALYGGDTETVRRCLADDLIHVGPTATFQTAEAWMKAAAHAPHGAQAVEIQTMLGDGEDVCVFYELVTSHRVGRIPIAEWHRVRDGKIASIRLIMDTGPFVKRAASSADTAVDPVCKMTVEKPTAPATRTHEGTTYYFCNPGCAAAFEREPAAYVTASSDAAAARRG